MEYAGKRTDWSGQEEVVKKLYKAERRLKRRLLCLEFWF